MPGKPILLKTTFRRVEKCLALKSNGILTWHFIGPLQSNKTRLVAEHFSWVHSVDRLRLAQRLSEQRPEQCAPLNVCVQVNISDEKSKVAVPRQKPVPCVRLSQPCPDYACAA